MSNGPDMSPTQRKRLEKISRLRRYFSEDDPRVYEWSPAMDETLDFASMSDGDVEQYLRAN
jgi:hypothetical protein